MFYDLAVSKKLNSIFRHCDMIINLVVGLSMLLPLLTRIVCIVLTIECLKSSLSWPQTKLRFNSMLVDHSLAPCDDKVKHDVLYLSSVTIIIWSYYLRIWNSLWIIYSSLYSSLLFMEYLYHFIMGSFLGIICSYY